MGHEGDSVEVSTSSETKGADRIVVRDSGGVVYVIASVGAGNLQMMKGNAQPVTSFAEQDAGNAPDSGDGDFEEPSIAIDSNDIIHMVWWDKATGMGESGGARYQTFSTVTDLWVGSAVLTSITITNAPVRRATTISVDVNDIPHICAVDKQSNMGAKDTVMYANRIGGSWNTAVEVRGATAERTCTWPSLTFAKDSGGTIVPQIAYFDSLSDTAEAALGNVLNATSWTIKNLEGSATVLDADVSIACHADQNNTYVAYSDATGNLSIIKHINTNGWSTWDTPVHVDTTNDWNKPSLAINGTDLYIHAVRRDTDDIHLWADTGSGFTDLGTNEGDQTENDVKTKWAIYNNNEGSVQLDISYERFSTQRYHLHTLSTVSTVQKTFTLNAILQAVKQKTFELDARLVNRIQALQTKTFAINARLVNLRTKTFLADAILKATQTKTFLANAILKATQTKTFLIDAILV